MASLLRFGFSLPQTKVLGTIPDTTAATFTKAEVSPVAVGPVGPRPFALHTIFVEYGGKLERGNDFGTCEVTLTGSYEGEEVIPRPIQTAPGLFGIGSGILRGVIRILGLDGKPETRKVRIPFIGTAQLTVTPPDVPVFTPPAITVSKGRPGPEGIVEVQVTPPGPYEVVFRTPSNSFISVLPTLLSTGSDGKGTVFVRDLLGEFPRGPYTVTGTISPQSPFRGPDVVGSFAVSVGP